MLKSLCVSSASLLILLSLPTPALAIPTDQSSIYAQTQLKQNAQTEITSEELAKFAQAIQEMRAIQLESRDKVAQAIQEEGLSKDRFREILQAQRNPEVENDASATEMEKFESASQKLAQIQRNTQSNMKAAVESQGLAVPRFQQILSSVREQPALQQQVQQMIQGEEN